jgi:hypothetical protein
MVFVNAVVCCHLPLAASEFRLSCSIRTGFILSDPSLLPPTRLYNKERGSKVYIKTLGSQRDVDAEELLWNI